MVNLDDSLLLISTDGAEERYKTVRAKRQAVNEAFSREDISVRGIENTAPFYICSWFGEHPNIMENYDRMRSFVKTEVTTNYNLDCFHELHNSDLLFRTYDLLKVMDICGINNKRSIKTFGSAALYNGVINSSGTSELLNELAHKSNNKHPQLLHKYQTVPAESDIGRATFYNKTNKNADAFIRGFEGKLIEVYPKSKYLIELNELVLKRVVSKLDCAGLIKHVSVSSVRTNGKPLTLNYMHIKGKDASKSAKDIHNNFFDDALAIFLHKWG